MIHNLVEYFLPEQEFYLDKIVYNRLPQHTGNSEYSLKCKDTVQVVLEDNGIRITVERILRFEPEEVFELAISFGAVLKFNDKKKQDHQWKDIDLSKEFIENGGFVIDNLMNRISLLVSQITSSFGQTPIVLPPSLMTKNI